MLYILCDYHDSVSLALTIEIEITPKSIQNLASPTHTRIPYLENEWNRNPAREKKLLYFVFVVILLLRIVTKPKSNCVQSQNGESEKGWDNDGDGINLNIFVELGI